MENLKKIITGVAVAAGLALTAPAALADGYEGAKGGKGPVYYAPVNWGGLYFGGHIGYGWSDADWTFLGANNAFNDRNLGDNPSMNVDGWLAGGQIGLQHQFGNIVAGVEVTLSGGDLHGNVLSTFNAADDVYRTELQWLTTVTGKLGYSFDRWLAYVKAGYASAHVVTSIVDTVPANVGEARQGETHSGWTVGFGLDYMFKDHISMGLEYSYIALEDKDHIRNGAAFLNDRVAIDDIHAVKFRLNFHLHRGGHDAPAPLK